MALHPLDQITLIILFIFAIAALGYFGFKRLNVEKKNLFRFIIIGESSTHYYSKKVDLDTEKYLITFNEKQYNGFKSRAYVVEHNFFEKLFFGINKEYLMIFPEAKKGQKEIIQYQPPDITEPVKQKDQEYLMITSSILYQVYKYRGAAKAFKEEFREESSFGIPIWAIFIAGFILIAVIVIAAEYMGFVDFVPTIGKVIKK